MYDNRQHFSACLENACSMYRGPCIDVHERANEGERGAREEYVSSRSRHAFVRVQSYGERKDLG